MKKDDTMHGEDAQNGPSKQTAPSRPRKVMTPNEILAWVESKGQDPKRAATHAITMKGSLDRARLLRNQRRIEAARRVQNNEGQFIYIPPGAKNVPESPTYIDVDTHDAQTGADPSPLTQALDWIKQRLSARKAT